MIKIFLATLSPMLVMLVCMVIGFVMKKKKITPDNTAIVLSKLENYVFVPALIVNTFLKYCTINSIFENKTIIFFSVLTILVAVSISVPLSKAFSNDKYTRNVYKYALTFGNASFIGNAIVPAILGESALFNYMLYCLPLNIAVYTWGLVILIPKTENKSVYKNLFNPMIVSMIIGTIMGIFGIESYLPNFISKSIQTCSSCMGCCAMLLTGFVIGEYDIKELLNKKKVYVASEPIPVK